MTEVKRHVFTGADAITEVGIEVQENGDVWLFDAWGDPLINVPSERFAAIVNEWQATQEAAQRRDAAIDLHFDQGPYGED